MTSAGMEAVPERRAHRAGSPRIGFDDIAGPQVLIWWPGITLSRVPGQQPVAEEVAVDVGDPCSMLRSDFTEFGVQLGQDSVDLRPRRQLNREAGSTIQVKLRTLE